MFTAKDRLQRFFSSLVVTVMALTLLGPTANAGARGGALPPNPPSLHATAQAATRHDVSPELRSIPVPQAEGTAPDRETLLFKLPRNVQPGAPIGVDPAWNVRSPLKRVIEPPMPGLDAGYDGLNQGGNRTIYGYGVYPPDTNGASNADFYIQIVNITFAVWDLNQTEPFTGQPLNVYGPAPIRALFTGFGGVCEDAEDGDPVVLYDHLANRWLLSQFALPNFPLGPFYECIAVSATSDPLGTWYRYEYQFTKMNDYPKFGVWPDAYYMSINQFEESTLAWAGQGVVAFERDAMLAGSAADMIYIDLFDDPAPFSDFGGMLPSDLDGSVPPAGAPNYFIEVDDDAWGVVASDSLRVASFDVDWTGVGTGTFTFLGDVTVAPFDSEVCLGYDSNCIPQPGTLEGLDAISDRLMYRLQYRNFGDYQTLVTNHTVDVNDVPGHAGVRWYELRNSGAGWSVYQQGTYAPDAEHRWMGSIAMDGNGNMALGFSLSSALTSPSIRYVGRLASDPLDTLPQTEATIKDGAGSQTGDANRWGDYSQMDVSPADDCQFWYTNEYYRSIAPAEWYTYIAGFEFPLPLAPGGDGCNPHPSFTDVTFSDWFSPWVFRLADLGITSGCGGGLYCPNNTVTRAEMAVFLLRAEHGAAYTPPAATGTAFGDVPISYWAAAWIEQLATEGITSGCGGGNYCPENAVTRAEMAVFLLRTEHGSVYTPPAATGTAFGDVPISYWAAAWIEQLAAEGITSGCGGGNYCPEDPVIRSQMAVFLIRLIELLP